MMGFMLTRRFHKGCLQSQNEFTPPLRETGGGNFAVNNYFVVNVVEFVYAAAWGFMTEIICANRPLRMQWN
jgi:hypothetical protein